jgi:hypothetical protein
MGYWKNYEICLNPWIEELDDFLTESQADEPHTHQPVSENELIPF